MPETLFRTSSAYGSASLPPVLSFLNRQLIWKEIFTDKSNAGKYLAGNVTCKFLKTENSLTEGGNRARMQPYGCIVEIRRDGPPPRSQEIRRTVPYPSVQPQRQTPTLGVSLSL